MSFAVGDEVRIIPNQELDCNNLERFYERTLHVLEVSGDFIHLEEVEAEGGFSFYATELELLELPQINPEEFNNIIINQGEGYESQ